jgi:hypothetical protein
MGHPCGFQVEAVQKVQAEQLRAWARAKKQKDEAADSAPSASPGEHLARRAVVPMPAEVDDSPAFVGANPEEGATGGGDR